MSELQVELMKTISERDRALSQLDRVQDKLTEAQEEAQHWQTQYQTAAQKAQQVQRHFEAAQESHGHMGPNAIVEILGCPYCKPSKDKLKWAVQQPGYYPDLFKPVILEI